MERRVPRTAAPLADGGGGVIVNGTSGSANGPFQTDRAIEAIRVAVKTDMVGDEGGERGGGREGRGPGRREIGRAHV